MESTPVENGENLYSSVKKERASPSSSEPGRQRRIFFETKSLAEVYAKQGHVCTALEIYRRVQKKNPSDQDIEKKISELQARRFPKRAPKAGQE